MFIYMPTLLQLVSSNSVFLNMSCFGCVIHLMDKYRKYIFLCQEVLFMQWRVECVKDPSYERGLTSKSVEEKKHIYICT